MRFEEYLCDSRARWESRHVRYIRYFDATWTQQYSPEMWALHGRTINIPLEINLLKAGTSDLASTFARKVKDDHLWICFLVTLYNEWKDMRKL